MNFLVLFIGICFCGISQAQTSFKIVDRNARGKMIYREVELPGLLNAEYAETAEFRIVEKKSDRALKWSELSSDDHLRAANLLHHLVRAKQKLLQEFNAQELKQLEQLVIRINITNQPHNPGHFANDAFDPTYNTVNTIPAGVGVAKYGVAPWKREIWFRPKKEIPIRDLLNQLSEDPLNPTLRNLRKILYPMEATLTSEGVVENWVSSAPVQAWQSLWLREGGTLLIMEAAFQAIKLVNRAVLPRTFFIDTAMIPEVIYHEFGHVAFSDYMNPTHSTAVGEGVADYLASIVSGNPTIAKWIKKYCKGIAKDGRKKKQFSIEYDTRGKATSDFVLSLLWGLGVQGKEKMFTREVANHLVWESRKYMNTFDSDIRHQLLPALVLSCQKVCPDPESDQLRLSQYFQSIFNQ